MADFTVVFFVYAVAFPAPPKRNLWKHAIIVVQAHKTIRFSSQNSWFAISLSGCGGQCQPPTPAGSDNGINNIFLCVVPPTWPP